MRIGIVTGSPLVRETLQGALALRPDHTVIWTAGDGAQAVACCTRATPDLVLMELSTTETGGIEATRRIMGATPCAILIVTPSVSAQSARVFEAMGHGAIDAVDTPLPPHGDRPADPAAFLHKLDTIAKLVGTRKFVPHTFTDTWMISRRERLVAMGASAGGPAALMTVLSGLPKDFPAAVIIVQHVDARFAEGMADWRLISPERVEYTAEPSELAYRPSVDVFLSSVAAHWSGEAVGVLLTGMGRDGAKGLKTLRDRGHYTIAQDQATSTVYGMPKAAASLGAAVDILPLERIAPRLIDTFRHKL